MNEMIISTYTLELFGSGIMGHNQTVENVLEGVNASKQLLQRRRLKTILHLRVDARGTELTCYVTVSCYQKNSYTNLSLSPLLKWLALFSGEFQGRLNFS